MSNVVYIGALLAAPRPYPYPMLLSTLNVQSSPLPIPCPRLPLIRIDQSITKEN